MLRDVPSPKTVFTEISDLSPTLYRAFEGAMLQGRSYFENGQRSVDKWLFNDLVRYHAKCYLSSLGLTPREMNNNGLSLVHGRYTVRMLKAVDGRSPFPGPTAARQGFYQQLHFPLSASLLDFVTRLRGEPINLLILWEPTPAYDLSRLIVAIPKNGTHDPATVQVYWQESLPHPALTIRPDEAAASSEEFDDLDITLPEEEDTGTEQSDD